VTGFTPPPDDLAEMPASGVRPNTVQNQPGGPSTENAILSKERILKSQFEQEWFNTVQRGRAGFATGRR